MAEKRFIWKCDDENCQIYDTKKKKAYFNVEVVDLLNEQQTTISALNEENEQLKKEYIDEMVTDYKKLEKENEQLKSRIAFFEEQEDEFEKYTAQTIQNMIADYIEG